MLEASEELLALMPDGFPVEKLLELEARAKNNGSFLPDSELNDMLPSSVNSPEAIDFIMEYLQSKGITVIWITHFMEEAALADRVLVVTDGSVRLTGTPAEVFGHVDAMREMHLDVPHMTALADELRREGMPIRDGVLTVEDLAQEVEKALCPLKSAT